MRVNGQSGTGLSFANELGELSRYHVRVTIGIVL
jgi:hypothetical protein